MLYSINSEIGRLKKVILHEPNLGLERLTPANHKAFLFNDTLDIAQALKEHRIFQRVLTDHGVEVFLLDDLLTQTLDIPEAKAWLIERRICAEDYGEDLYIFLKEYLHGLSASELMQCFVGGLTKNDIHTCPVMSLVFKTFTGHHFILPPLPNHLFMRDSSCWISNGVSINQMAKWRRRAEAFNLKAIYQFHPMFSKEYIPIWYGGDKKIPYAGALEGGDILVIGNGALLIGMGERTTPQAVEILSHALFSAGKAREIIVVSLPKKSRFMHLDTVITMLDRDAFIVYEDILDHMTVWRLRPKEHGGLVVEKQPDLFQALSVALGIKTLHIVATNSEEEQGDSGNNMLAIAPGVLIAYAQNVLTNAKLRQAGFNIIEVPGVELGKGRGGTRCMSCPLLREE